MVVSNAEMTPSPDTNRPTGAPTKRIISTASNAAHDSMQYWFQDTDQAKPSRSSKALQKIGAASLAFSSQHAQHHCDQQPFDDTTVELQSVGSWVQSSEM